MLDERKTEENRGAGIPQCSGLRIAVGESTQVDALIDTGAKISCISELWYIKNANHLNKFPMFPVVNTQVSGCTGEKSVRVKRQILLPITVVKVTKQINFLIVPGLTKACILGIDALKAFNSIINVRDDTFYAQDDDGIALRISYDSREGEQVTCHTVANIDISLDEIEAKVRQTELDIESQNKLIQVCVKHREYFRKVPGRFRSYEYEIHMKNDEPFAIKSYPVPIKYREQVSREIYRMLEYGVIERAKTPFINPLVAVAKKDNTVRLCLDARQINDRMLEDHDGPEEIDQVLRQCNNIGVMSTLDLRSSFWQVPLAKSSRKYTGFLHQGRTYQFTVVPFGLKVASAALNRAAEGVLNIR
uniref:Peptidase A2 domain-containing protein n=1 Tax=Trichogramma kaykai TaxID=54128 RepID=A0ABD2W6S1_9HYME